MYPFVLGLHNLLRWAVLLSALYSLFALLPGLSGTRPWTATQNRATVIYSGLMQLQLVVGLALYLGVSPYMRGILDNFGAAMRDSTERFFAVEHITGMVVAVAFAVLARSLSRRIPDTQERRKYRAASLWTALSLLAVLAFIPWWRPLLRL